MRRLLESCSPAPRLQCGMLLQTKVAGAPCLQWEQPPPERVPRPWGPLDHVLTTLSLQRAGCNT